MTFKASDQRCAPVGVAAQVELVFECPALESAAQLRAHDLSDAGAVAVGFSIAENRRLTWHSVRSTVRNDLAVAARE